MEQPQKAPFVMSLESKRRSIGKSHFKTDPVTDPKKFSKMKLKFEQFVKNQKKKSDDSEISFNHWYMLMEMPCECDETKIWNYETMPINVYVTTIDDDKPISDSNSRRKCAKCRLSAN